MEDWNKMVRKQIEHNRRKMRKYNKIFSDISSVMMKVEHNSTYNALDKLSLEYNHKKQNLIKENKKLRALKGANDE